MSEHTPRRTGTQFHIVSKRLETLASALHGRWGSAIVEIYTAEASAKINASGFTLVAKGIDDDLGVCADDPGAANSAFCPGVGLASRKSTAHDTMGSSARGYKVGTHS